MLEILLAQFIYYFAFISARKVTRRYILSWIATKRESNRGETKKIQGEREGEGAASKQRENQTDLSESTGLTTCLPASRYATGWGSLRTVSNLR
jgi:hypothetical protein